MRKGLEPPQERDSRSYGDEAEMKAMAPHGRLKKRSKRGLVRHKRHGKR